MGLRSRKAQIERTTLTRAGSAPDDIGHATARSSDRVTARGALSALALGALLGGVGVLCSQWLGGTSLLCIALQSAFSMMVFGIVTSARPMDLIVDMQSLETCLESGNSRPYERQNLCGQITEARLRFAPS